MRKIGTGLAQFAAIVMIMITFAVSTAALSMWMTDGSTKTGTSNKRHMRLTSSGTR